MITVEATNLATDEICINSFRQNIGMINHVGVARNWLLTLTMVTAARYFKMLGAIDYFHNMYEINKIAINHLRYQVIVH